VLKRRLRKALAAIVGNEHLKTEPAELALYSYDATPQADPAMPDAVVLPGSAEEVARLVELANEQKLPIVARGAGTNLTGGARAIRGGLVVSTQRMNKILSVDESVLQAVVQPGVVTRDLHRAVEEKNLFYPPDPQSHDTCTIGGNLAENAGGPRAVKYGVTRHFVLALQVVLPTGELVRLGARTIKSVAGYDMVSLLVGSEGTLGIITEATLRLIPLPRHRGTVLAVFSSLETAASSVGAILQAGVLPSALEFVDGPTIECIQQHQPIGLPEDARAALVIEVDGAESQVAHETARVISVLESSGATELRQAADQKEAEVLWQARKAAGPALASIAPHKFNEDIVVPITKLPQAVSGIHEIAKKHGVACACFGHAGDGNIHANFLVHPEDLRQAQEVHKAVEETFQLVLSLGGSITGEHGVGTTKQAFLGKELSPTVMTVMRKIKDALDPNGIMNPGKIFPTGFLIGPNDEAQIH